MAETKRALATLLTNISDGGSNTAEEVRDAILTLFDGLYTPAIYTTDGNPTLTVGEMTTVSLTNYTSVHTATLPATAAVGDRVGVMITTGHATHELAIRTPASDTINGTDYSAADWSKLFITGESMIFKCVVANTDWIVEHDGRIPCRFMATMSADATAESSGTWMRYTSGTGDGFDTEAEDVGDCYDAATDTRLEVRRDGMWDLSLNSIPLVAIGDGSNFAQALYDGTDRWGTVLVASGSSSGARFSSGAKLTLTDGATITPQFKTSQGSCGIDADNAAQADRSSFSGVEDIELMYIVSAASVLIAAGYDSDSDFAATAVAGGVEIVWTHADPQPTEQQVSDWSMDAVALPSGQLFSEWQAENGGDTLKTNQRKARDTVAETTGLGVRGRAEMGERNKRDNYLANRIIQLENVIAAMLESAGNTANLRSAGIAAAAVAFPQTQTTDAATHFAATETRTWVDARTDLITEIDSGDSDT